MLMNKEIEKEPNKGMPVVPFDIHAFQLAYDHNPQAFCIVYVLKEEQEVHDVLFVYANIAYGKMFGFPLEKLLGHTYTELVGKPDEKWNKICGDVAYGGGSNSMLAPKMEMDAYIRVQCFQIAPGYCGSNVLDVTQEIKETRKAKEEGQKTLDQMGFQRALYQSILDTTKDMVTVIDAETYRIIYANSMAKKVTQYMEEGYVGSICYQSIKHCEQPCEDCMLLRMEDKSEETKDLQYGDKIYSMTYKKTTWNGRRVLIEYSSDVTVLREKEKAFQQQVDFIVNLDWDNLIAKGRHNLTKNKPVKVTGKNPVAVVGNADDDYDSMVVQLANTAILENQRKEMLDILDRKKLLKGFSSGTRELTFHYCRNFQNRGLRWVTLKGALYQEPETKDIIAFYYTYDDTDQILRSMVTQKLSKALYLILGVIDVKSKLSRILYIKGSTGGENANPDLNYDLAMENQFQKMKIMGNREEILGQLSYQKVVESLLHKEYYTVDFSKIVAVEKHQRSRFQFCYLDENKNTILYYSTDITESYEQEQQQLENIQNALKQAESSNHAKTDFLSRMSHDMRTPMNGVLGLVTLLLDEEMPDKVREGLLQIQFSGKYLLNLINDILDVNKIELNRLELHYKPTDAYKLTENVATNARILAADKGVSFDVVKIHPEEITPTILLMDEARTEQLFMNLVSNAIKFTPKGGHVWVSIERLETTEDYTTNRYQFKDTGIGMSKEFLRHIYEPFSQEGRAHTTREGGTGLGMAIVSRLVKLMGATLQVESEINVGTTFTLTARFQRFKGEFNEPEEKKYEEEKLSGKRVLLCEDHPLNRQIAERLLMKKGMIVDSAEDGMQGCELFRNSPENYYDLILMDIRMPKLNGFEATRTIRALKRKDADTIPIIAMTANAFDSDIKNCLDAGMNAHISKPIEVEKMYQTISEYLC